MLGYAVYVYLEELLKKIPQTLFNGGKLKRFN